MFIASDRNVDSALFNTENIRADCRVGIETESRVRDVRTVQKKVINFGG